MNNKFLEHELTELKNMKNKLENEYFIQTSDNTYTKVTFAEKVVINIGKDVFVELELSEANKYIEDRIKVLSKKLL